MRLRLSLWESHHNRQAFEPCSVCYIQSPNPEFWCCAAIQILEAVLAVLALGSWRMGRMGEHLAALHPVLHSKACVLFYLKLVQKKMKCWHKLFLCDMRYATAPAVAGWPSELLLVRQCAGWDGKSNCTSRANQRLEHELIFGWQIDNLSAECEKC